MSIALVAGSNRSAARCRSPRRHIGAMRRASVTRRCCPRGPYGADKVWQQLGWLSHFLATARASHPARRVRVGVQQQKHFATAFRYASINFSSRGVSTYKTAGASSGSTNRTLQKMNPGATTTTTRHREAYNGNGIRRPIRYTRKSKSNTSRSRRRTL